MDSSFQQNSDPQTPKGASGELSRRHFLSGLGTAGILFTSGLKLGEDVAITILRDLNLTYNESFSGCSLPRFDGTQITIEAGEPERNR